MIRMLTPNEQEDMAIRRIKYKAYNQNAVIFKCGHVEHFPNVRTGNIRFINNMIHVPYCQECNPIDASGNTVVDFE